MYFNLDTKVLSFSSNKRNLATQKKINKGENKDSFASDDKACCEKNMVRHRWISEAAYFKAETRSFVPDHELDDWLEVERHYSEMLVTTFLSVCNEDGGFTKDNLRKLAKSIGVKKPENIFQISELVRAIQKATQHRPCFQSDQYKSCQEIDCKWRSECKKLIAEWMR